MQWHVQQHRPGREEGRSTEQVSPLDLRDIGADEAEPADTPPQAGPGALEYRPGHGRRRVRAHIPLL